jgi:hypothetical protein
VQPIRKEEPMSDQMGLDEVSPATGWQPQRDDLLVDSAISHLEKLRRVLMLEEWIRAASGDALLVGTCREWRAERQQLLDELHLRPVAERRS